MAMTPTMVLNLYQNYLIIVGMVLCKLLLDLKTNVSPLRTPLGTSELD